MRRIDYALCLMLMCTPHILLAASPDPSRLASIIDRQLEEIWKEAGIKPVVVADDATFVRRVSLDLIGRIPTVAEARQFQADTTPDKREKLIKQLMASGGYQQHLATFWRRTWLPQTDTPEYARLADDFEAWISSQIVDNKPYNQLIQELLLAQSTNAPTPRAVSPKAFFTANEDKPENIAANMTRAFLGINLDCAQCHNHPFARWTREQFWQTAAFFVNTSTPSQKSTPPTIAIPNTATTVTAQLLDGQEMKWPEQLNPNTNRTLLTNWVIAKGNPYFARNVVNRIWGHLFGNALVEPMDDLSGEQGSQGPFVPLLQTIANEFVAHNYNLNFLIEGMLRSRAYHLASITQNASLEEVKMFARMPVRGLTGEQLYDSLRTAAGLPPERADVGRGLGRTPRKQFTATFLVERAVTAERSISQALSLLNGQLVNNFAQLKNNPTVDGLILAPFLSPDERIDVLFFATVGRKPTVGEMKKMVNHIQTASEADRDRAYGDLFWALVNSTEFNTNH